MLYRSTDRLCRCGAPVQYLSHSASFHSLEKYAPPNAGTKQVANDEIEKLLKRGEGWLGSHPDKDLIVSRYLKRQRSLTREALSRLLAEDTPSDETEDIPSMELPSAERTPSLHDQR